MYEQGPTNRYFNIRQADGALLTRETYDDSGDRTMSRTYHYDGLGSTIALTNENGQVTDTYPYDAWGNVTPGEANITTDNPYQFGGQSGGSLRWPRRRFAAAAAMPGRRCVYAIRCEPEVRGGT